MHFADSMSTPYRKFHLPLIAVVRQPARNFECSFFYFLQIYNLLYKLSNKQICYKETLYVSVVAHGGTCYSAFLLLVLYDVNCFLIFV
jgi:hypothetical protein